ncbi:MAG: hypothetical protein KGD59_01555 [Candidatus Heimdallarchaeota archaeon]|nr:hypothetical protein [Candidatus Heimdallarchaeota archaeon]MBY8993206.1 hypothetical protein [Candidatus Heimdallarchaeota archaeon]
MKIFFDETQKERGKINTNYSILRDSLRSEGLEVEVYNDFPISEKTLKCDVFVFACPDGSKLGKNEIDSITNFVEKGGGLLIIGNAGGDRGLRTNMNEILNQFGIEMVSDQVKDETNNEFNMPTHPVINDVKEHPIGNGVAEIVIVAGCSIRGSSNMKGIAYTSPAAEPPNAPVLVAGEYKQGRVVAVGSYRLFSNYGAGLSLRNNRTFAMNMFRWLGRLETGKAPSVAVKKETKIDAIVPPKTEPVATDMKPSSIPPPPTTVAPRASQTQAVVANDQNVLQEIERLRSEISEMREIIARLYSDSLGYLQEMKEEVRSMLDYIRTKEG